jgi:hypothetical protein
MISQFGKSIAQLSIEQRISFYEIFAHNLTICVRAIWSDEAIDVEEKIEQMKWLNEILHRVTAKIRCDRTQSHEWLDIDMQGMVEDWVNHNPYLTVLVNDAIDRSYNYVSKNP